MKNKVLVMVLVMLLVFSCTAAVFADSGIQPYSTGNITFLIERTSGTTADVDITVTFTGEADEYSVVVYLQKLVNGSWKNDSTNPEYVFYNNGFNSYSCLFAHDYDSLVYGTSYRLMVVSRDKQGSNEYRSTFYSRLF
ncbi:MAG: hypothetical protein PUD12_03545 [Firmicutes bacterium]|nr:hypothetical protein [Bacillota bacterium]